METTCRQTLLYYVSYSLLRNYTYAFIEVGSEEKKRHFSFLKVGDWKILFFQKVCIKLGLVVYTLISVLWKWRQEGCVFKARISILPRPLFWYPLYFRYTVMVISRLHSELPSCISQQGQKTSLDCDCF